MNRVGKPKVKLVGQDGNAFSVMGLTVRAMRMAGESEERIREYQSEAMSGDYNHLLVTTMEYVDIE
jgi:hypothetical protein